jgi:hypothetical protein
MNLYIINDILCDYTCGMCVIAAESMPRCEEIFVKEFAPGGSDYVKECMQKDFNTSAIKVIENVPYNKEEVVSYVYGGG